MNEALTLTLWNSILPLAGLCALVAWLPGWVAGRGNLSHGALSRAVGVTAVVALVVGAVLAAGLYAAISEGVWAGVLAAPLERAGFFLGRSALFALLWGPVLGFVWLVKAQELNRRLGKRMVDEGGNIEKSNFFRRDNPILWGLVLSSILAAIVLFLVLFTKEGNLSRTQEFTGLALNAIGDTLAGIFAPLAFIWIVVTVFLQSQELSEQRKELALTREELRLAREAQEKQLEVMQEQAEIFRNEMRQRSELEHDTLMGEVLKSLVHELTHGKSRYMKWYCTSIKDDDGTSYNAQGRTETLIGWFPDEGEQKDVHVRNAIQNLRDAGSRVANLLDEHKFHFLPSSAADLLELEQIMVTIENFEPKCSVGMKEHLRRLAVIGAAMPVRSLRGNNRFWKDGATV